MVGVGPNRIDIASRWPIPGHWLILDGFGPKSVRHRQHLCDSGPDASNSKRSGPRVVRHMAKPLQTRLGTVPHSGETPPYLTEVGEYSVRDRPTLARVGQVCTKIGRTWAKAGPNGANAVTWTHVRFGFRVSPTTLRIRNSPNFAHNFQPLLEPGPTFVEPGPSLVESSAHVVGKQVLKRV